MSATWSRKPPQLADVFVTGGSPRQLFIDRRDAEGENQVEAIRTLIRARKHVAVSGPLGSGKTWLWQRAVDQHVEVAKVRCLSSMTAPDLWRQVLSGASISRGGTTKRGGKQLSRGNVSGGVASSRILPISLEIKASLERGEERLDEQTEDRFQSDPTCDTFCQFAKVRGLVLVVDELQRLRPEAFQEFCEDLKTLCDEGVPAITVTQDPRRREPQAAVASVVRNSVPVRQSPWTRDELAGIAKEGFALLGVAVDATLVALISTESRGRPDFAHLICYELLREHSTGSSGRMKSGVKLSSEDLQAACRKIASERFSEALQVVKTLESLEAAGASLWNPYGNLLRVLSWEAIVGDVALEDCAELLGRYFPSEVESPLTVVKLGDQPDAESPVPALKTTGQPQAEPLISAVRAGNLIDRFSTQLRSLRGDSLPTSSQEKDSYPDPIRVSANPSTFSVNWPEFFFVLRWAGSHEPRPVLLERRRV